MELTVRRQSEILKDVIRVRLLYVCTVKLERHEHYTSKEHNAKVAFSDDLVLLRPGPSRERIETMKVLPT